MNYIETMRSAGWHPSNPAEACRKALELPDWARDRLRRQPVEDRIGVLRRWGATQILRHLGRGNVADIGNEEYVVYEKAAFYHMWTWLGASVDLDLRDQDIWDVWAKQAKWEEVRFLPARDRLWRLVHEERSDEEVLDPANEPALTMALLQCSSGVCDPERDLKALRQGLALHYQRRAKWLSAEQAAEQAEEDIPDSPHALVYWYERAGQSGRVGYVADGQFRVNPRDVRDAIPAEDAPLPFVGPGPPALTDPEWDDLQEQAAEVVDLVALEGEVARLLGVSPDTPEEDWERVVNEKARAGSPQERARKAARIHRVLGEKAGRRRLPPGAVDRIAQVFGVTKRQMRAAADRLD